MVPTTAFLLRVQRWFGVTRRGSLPATAMSPAFVRICLATVCGWLTTIACVAQSDLPRGAGANCPPLPRDLDLRSALSLALEHNPVIAEVREQIREQEGVLIVAKAERRPRVDVVGAYDVIQNTRIEGFGPFESEGQSWNFDVRLSHTIYAGGQLAASSKSAAARVCAAESRMRTVIDGVLLEVSRHCFDALLAKEVIAVQEEAVGVLDRQLQTAKAAYDAGSRPQFDVLQAEVALANARPPVIRARNQYRLAIDRLRRAIGMPYPDGCEADKVRLTQSWPNPKVNEQLGALLLQGLANRPELAELANQIKAAESDIQAAKSMHKPRVEMYGTYGAQSLRFAGNAGEGLAGATGGVRFTVPIFDFGRTEGQVVQATSRLQEIEARTEQQRLSIEGEVRQAFFDYDEASQILRTSELVVKQAEEALRLAQNRFHAGALTQLEILQSRLELTRAQLERAQALHSYNVAAASLRHAVGTISREVAGAAKEQ